MTIIKVGQSLFKVGKDLIQGLSVGYLESKILFQRGTII